VSTDDPTETDAAVGFAEATRSRGRFVVRRYDIEAVRAAIPGWDDHPKSRRLAALSLFQPVSVSETTNTPTVGQHELLADYLATTTAPTETAAHLAVGDDNATAPAYRNRSLNNERYRTPVADSSPDDTTIRSVVYLDATEANNMDAVREAGLCTAGTQGEGKLLNHALVGPEPKSSTVALTVRGALSWEAAQ